MADVTIDVTTGICKKKKRKEKNLKNIVHLCHELFKRRKLKKKIFFRLRASSFFDFINIYIYLFIYGKF